MSDESNISTAIARMLYAVDALDWDRVRDAFADEVVVDYTSLLGGSVSTLPTEQLLGNWKALLPGFDATQHLIGPVVIVSRDSGRITAEAHIRAYHYIKGVPSGETWTVAGHYSFEMKVIASTYKITSLKLETYYQEGNRELPGIAQKRAAAEPRRIA